MATIGCHAADDDAEAQAQLRGIPFVDVEIPLVSVGDNGSTEDTDGQDQTGRSGEKARQQIPNAQLAPVLALLREMRPEWATNTEAIAKLNYEPFTNGITNSIFAIQQNCAQANDDDVAAKRKECIERLIFRVFGAGTEKLIDRNKELVNFALLSRAGIGAPVLARFRNGIVCGYLPGECLSVQTVCEPAIVRKICEKMARMHKIRVVQKSDDGSNQNAYESARANCTLFAQLRKSLEQFSPAGYADLAKKREAFDEYFTANVVDLHKDFGTLCAKLDECAPSMPLVFSHNDLLIYNILHDAETDQLSFIDYEYAGLNFQLFDIGNHFCEYSGVLDPDYSRCPSNEKISAFLRLYFEYFHRNQETKMTEDEMTQLIQQVHFFEAASHLFWVVWALVQSQLSALDFDYIGYAKLRHKKFAAIMRSEGTVGSRDAI